MSVKLSKVTKDLNVGLSTAVDFLHQKGFADVEENPNARITDDQFDLLHKEFCKDKDQKIESEIMAMRHKEKSKSESVVLEGFKQTQPEEIKVEIADNERPQLKTVGKIDLESLNYKKSEPQPKAEPVAPVEPVKEEKNVEKVEAPIQKEIIVEPKIEKEQVKKIEPLEDSKANPVVEPKLESKIREEIQNTTNIEQGSDNTQELDNIENEVSKPAEEIFSMSKPPIQSTINVVGKIDLASLNQQTRPKKKTKEEKRKEREVKYPSKQNSGNNTNSNAANTQNSQNNQNRPQNSPNNAPNANAGAGGDEKRKRNRIQKERIDINKPIDDKSRKPSNNKFSKDKRPFEHAQPNEEDVQKQVKETLALLTGKSKSKTSKYRRDKRDATLQRMQNEAEAELLEGKTIKITEFVTVNELATMMNVAVTQVIATCMNLGLMVSINQRLDAETINIVADEFGFKTEYISAEVSETINEVQDVPEELVPRAPIVTVMGHVDHGKTSLLDYIRKANVIAGEAGGITQHIGAYNVTLDNGQHITFLDTPGHEAFTAMRARGTKVTDIAIIIVAADDDVMPQTKEAINHASAAGVPIVFAINKVDKPNANPDKIKEALAGMNYLVEEWGGKYQSQDISAKKGTGVKELLDKVLLEAEMLDLKANPNKLAVGSIIESSLDKGRGYLSTVLVEGGTLRMGDVMVAGINFGRVKAMFNERNQRIKEVKPGEPVLILGLNGAPQAGDRFNVLETEQEAREITNKREQLQREQSIRTKKHLTLDELGRRIALGNFQELNIIVKGDVDGSIEALSDSLIKLSTPEIQVNVIHKAVGAISESDVLLAAASNAIVVGFQVRPSQAARRIAEREEIDIRLYSIIYDAIEEIRDAMEGMLSPEIKEEVTATLEVMQVFKITKVGSVAGCLVREGKIKRNNKVRLIRDGIVIHSGDLGSLKRMKDDVKEVNSGFECGLNLSNYNDILVGDLIESFEEVEIKKTL